MAVESAQEGRPVSPTGRLPLGLPRGSVRALLTLTIVAVVCTEVLRGRKPDPLWIETLMIALAHYFTSRRFVDLPPELVHRLEREGVLPREPHPLYLPRLTIRLAIVLAFTAVAVILHQAGRLFDQETFPTLGLVLAYLIGVMARGLRQWLTGGRTTRLGRWLNDLKALATLVMLPVAAAAYLLDRPDLLPGWFGETTLGLVLFYFGSR